MISTLPFVFVEKVSDFGRRRFYLFGATSVQFNRRNEKLDLELSNATLRI